MQRTKDFATYLSIMLFIKSKCLLGKPVSLKILSENYFMEFYQKGLQVDWQILMAIWSKMELKEFKRVTIRTFLFQKSINASNKRVSRKLMLKIFIRFFDCI